MESERGQEMKDNDVGSEVCLYSGESTTIAISTIVFMSGEKLKILQSSSIISIQVTA